MATPRDARMGQHAAGCRSTGHGLVRSAAARRLANLDQPGSASPDDVAPRPPCPMSSCRRHARCGPAAARECLGTACSTWPVRTRQFPPGGVQARPGRILRCSGLTIDSLHGEPPSGRQWPTQALPHHGGRRIAMPAGQRTGPPMPGCCGAGLPAAPTRLAEEARAGSPASVAGRPVPELPRRPGLTGMSISLV